MRYLGIDFGLKRIGLALSDPQGKMALAYQTLYKENREQIFASILQIINEKKVEALVVGLPYGLDGQETLSTKQAKNFSQSLQSRTGLPVYTFNEALSSQEAQSRLKAAGTKSKKIKEILDQEAAAIILESFHQSRKSNMKTE